LCNYLEGKVALVTGGTSGIGKASAIALARSGAKVVLAGRRITEGQAIAKEIQASGGEAICIQADVTDETQVKNLIEKTLANYGSWTAQ
jgi:NADP-dependent 3-hydroxy acid dehydrogenase YdfG